MTKKEIDKILEEVRNHPNKYSNHPNKYSQLSSYLEEQINKTNSILDSQILTTKLMIARYHDPRTIVYCVYCCCFERGNCANCPWLKFYKKIPFSCEDWAEEKKLPSINILCNGGEFGKERKKRLRMLHRWLKKLEKEKKTYLR